MSDSAVAARELLQSVQAAVESWCEMAEEFDKEKQSPDKLTITPEERAIMDEAEKPVPGETQLAHAERMIAAYTSIVAPFCRSLRKEYGHGVEMGMKHCLRLVIKLQHIYGEKVDASAGDSQPVDAGPAA